MDTQDNSEEGRERPENPDSGAMGREAGSGCKNCMPGTILSGVVSGLLLGLGLLNLLFLLPLQISAVKRGFKSLLAGGGIAFLTALLMWVVRGAGSALVTGLIGPAGLFAGLVLLNMFYSARDYGGSDMLPKSWSGYQAWLRMLLALLPASAGMLLTLLILNRSGVWEEFLTLMQSTPEAMELYSQLVPGLAFEEFAALIQGLMYRTLAVSSAIVLLLSYGIGVLAVRGLRVSLSGLRSFTLPDSMIWAFILSLGLLVIAERLHWELAGWLIWNLFLLASLLYVIRGAAVLAGFVLRRPVLMALMPGFIVMVFIVPGVNLILTVLLLALGLSSVWIRYSDGTGVAGSAGSP